MARQAKFAALLALCLPATMLMGCHQPIERGVAAFGVSGTANPGGRSVIAESQPERQYGYGGSGLTDTRGTYVTGAKASAGTPQLGETGEVPANDGAH